MNVENQHKQIKGYRDLSQEEIDLMNKIKALAERVGELVKEVVSKTVQDIGKYECSDDDPDSDGAEDALHDAPAWAWQAKKDLQLGFMQLIRAVAKPTTF